MRVIHAILNYTINQKKDQAFQLDLLFTTAITLL
jgi:hypothetical protein